MGEHPRDGVFLELEAERLRQDGKWGEQNHPDGTDEEHVRYRDFIRDTVALAFRQGRGTWLHVLTEEFYEVSAEADPAKLREELVQVAAVAVAWVEAIDRRPL